jgi:hyperosmotically inducible protein
MAMPENEQPVEVRVASHQVLAEVIPMFRFGISPTPLFASIAVLAATLATAGCRSGNHPEVKLAVYNALDQNDLRSVTVFEDRQAGVITLSGIVGADDRKQRADQLAQQAAPGYSIVDHIKVDSAGLEGEEKAAVQTAQLDSAIEDYFKATLQSDPALRKQKIEYSAYNGTLTLKGSVNTVRDRKQAEDLAKKIPQVQRVVNEIQIKPGKPSPANS